MSDEPKKKRGRPKKAKTLESIVEENPEAVEPLKETIETQEEINREIAIRRGMERRRRKFWFH